MIYLINFFARKIEAVSRQVELARKTSRDPIITCCYLLNQKPLRLKDIKDNIWIFPPWLYPIVTFIIVSLTKCDIHLFEDEPSWWRKVALNLRKRKIYVSLFKDINPKLIRFLNQIKNLKSVSVEEEVSKKFVEKLLKNKSIPVFLIYPPPLWKSTDKKTTPKFGRHYLMASWNGGSLRSLRERGVVDLLNITKLTSGTCTIILRDSHVDQLVKILDKMRIKNKVNLILPKNFNQLKKEFLKANYVVNIPQKPTIKHTPNSLIDGIAIGKPVIISNCLRFSDTVKDKRIGIVLNKRNIKNVKVFSRNMYRQISKECSIWARTNLSESYKAKISRMYVK